MGLGVPRSRRPRARPRLPNSWVLIGLPIFQRAWVLPTWFDAIRGQDWSLDQVGFIFEVAPDDPETAGALFEWHGRHPEVRCFEVAATDIAHQEHSNGVRKWSPERYNTMVALRNRLLDRAVCYDPDAYFSLDSDIILEDSTTISKLFALVEAGGAASPLTFMTPEGSEFPNVMTFIPGHHQHRALRMGSYPLGSTFQADIIMAAVMMSRPVYQQSRYHVHPQGEDLGWAWHCRTQGLKLWSASDIYASHLMREEMLEPYLRDGDLRRAVAHPRRLQAAAASTVVVSDEDAHRPLLSGHP